MAFRNVLVSVLCAVALSVPDSAAAPIVAQISNLVGGRASDSFRYIGVNFDFWPTTKSKWDNSGALILNLTQPSLRVLARGLSGAMLRLGGSPADFLLYEVDADACSVANLNKTQPHGGGYFCPIWDQAPGQCLTMNRWQELLEFAADAGLSVTLDLNACWGRESTNGDMDWSLIDGLLAITAAARSSWGAALFGVEFGNEVYDNISPTVYGLAVARLRARIDSLWLPPGPPAPRVIGPDCWCVSFSYSRLFFRTAFAVVDSPDNHPRTTLVLQGKRFIEGLLHENADERGGRFARADFSRLRGRLLRADCGQCAQRVLSRRSSCNAHLVARHWPNL